MSALTRRDAMGAFGAAAGGAVVAASPAVGSAAAQEVSGEWFSNTSNYDGVVDRTGESEATVAVGTEANGGAFGFGPPAVRVDPGTTVVWEWTSAGAQHNVVAEDGTFESELTDEEGHTFSRTAEEAGVIRYVCTPHETMGMVGAVLVGDAASVADAGGESTGTDGGEPTAAGGGGGDPPLDMETALVASLLGAILSPIAFGLFLAGRDRGDQSEERPAGLSGR